MNLYNITKRLFPIVFLLISITGSIIFTYLYLTDTIISSPSWLVLFPLVGIVTLIYILFGKRRPKMNPEIVIQPQTNLRVIQVLDFIFYIGITVLLITLITNEIRSIPYIIILSILASSITASALISSNKIAIHHALIKSIILFGIASLSIFKIFYWTGRDTWSHAAVNYQLAQDGWLFAGMGKELQTPLYHVAVAITEILSGLDVRTATITAVTIPLIILFSLGVFLVARSIIGSQYAIIAVIIADFIGIVPYWSSWGQSTTYASMIFAIMLVPLFRLLSGNQTRESAKWCVLFIFFTLSIALTHLYSTFILAIYLGGVLFAWFVVDVFLNRKSSRIPVLSTIGGLAIVAGYATLTNISLMLGEFQRGINRFMGRFDISDEPVINTDESIIPPVSGTSTPGIDNPIIPDTEITDTLLTTDISTLIQNCFTTVEPSILSSLLSGGTHYALLLIPLVLGCLFIVNHCFKPNITGFKRLMWYLLIPALMIFFLLFVTTFAAPSMNDRPHYYLPIFLGLILASIIWWHTTSEGESKRISKSSLVTILLIVFIVVSLGTLSTMEEKAGLFDDDKMSLGHYASEIYGVETVLDMIQTDDDTTIYRDNEMKFVFEYALRGQGDLSIKQKYLNQYIPSHNDEYILFKESITKGVTQSYTQYNNSELKKKEVGQIRIDQQYKVLMDRHKSKFYENGELNVWV